MHSGATRGRHGTAPVKMTPSLRGMLLPTASRWRLGLRQDELLDSLSAPRHLLSTIADQFGIAGQLLLGQLQSVQISIGLDQSLDGPFGAGIQANGFKKLTYGLLILLPSHVEIAQCQLGFGKIRLQTNSLLN